MEAYSSVHRAWEAAYGPERTRRLKRRRLPSANAAALDP